MKTIAAKAKELLDQHSNLCAVERKDFYAGVKYVPECSYEYDEEAGDTVFNQPFHELVLRIGVIDSSQDLEERFEVGQAYIIDTKTLSNYAMMTENTPQE